jgi:rfaE bifunctional protein kinase chain/domain
MDLARLRSLLDVCPNHTVLVAGDFFLDKYLEIDPALSEPSLETGLEAYQVVGVRCYPGAAGTVANNLRALDVNVVALSVVGEDGEAADLRRGLAQSGVDLTGLISAYGRFTPTYMKPMLRVTGAPARELNRLDTKNRYPLPTEVEAQVIAALQALLPRVQGVVICDQVSEPNCGVITDRMRDVLSVLARSHPAVVFVADSRERIGLFRSVTLKPNVREAKRATGLDDLTSAGEALRRSADRPVIVTHGDQGAFVFTSDAQQHVPAIRVAGPLDIVGAGDSAMAGLVAALCGGAAPAEAALVGNLVASLTIQQLGATGTATRAQVLARFEEAQAERLRTS